MRKAYTLPNIDDPVEYLARPSYSDAPPTAKIGTTTSPIASFTLTIVVDFGRAAGRIGKDHSGGRHD